MSLGKSDYGTYRPLCRFRRPSPPFLLLRASIISTSRVEGGAGGRTMKVPDGGIDGGPAVDVGRGRDVVGRGGFGVVGLGLVVGLLPLQSLQ